MATYYNVRGGTIRLSTDGPVYHGVATEIADGVAIALNEQVHVKSYLDSDSLVCHINGKFVGTAKAKKKLFEMYPDLKPKSKTPRAPEPDKESD